ncbi:MAG: stage II sporulation protein R [Oscillospiraceae bacterium]|nr:stage II sporulation protein R [Oscillospiraceae bacterium]
MRFRRWETALMIGLAVALVLGYAAQAEEVRLSEKLVRLHVIADGDGEEQQALKLAVRDAVLETVNPIVDGADDRLEALERLSEALPEIEAAAKLCVASQGRDETVRVSLEQTAFPTKEYGQFALPAGDYLALRVVLGSGKGQNWWCVVFPPLCTAASAEEFDAAAADAGLTQSEQKLITRDGESYVLKFKFLEWWGSIKQFFGW